MAIRPAPTPYSERNVHTMESIYGEGFLSPGGAKEVAQIVAALPVEGAEVLDLGCGLGGASIALAREHGAAHVTGADIEPVVLARAESLVAKSGLSTRVTLREVAPGPLPFAGASFDLAYASAVTCHIEDLLPFFVEVRRVLRSGAHFTGAEWFVGARGAGYSWWDELLRERGLDFHFVSWEDFSHTLVAAGFEAPNFTDRSAATSDLSARALERVRGELRPDLESALGADGYEAFENWTASRAAALGEGGVHYGHFQARNGGRANV